MTKYKVYRVSATGAVTVEVVEAYDWLGVINQYQWAGDPIFKIEVCGGLDPVEMPTYTS